MSDWRGQKAGGGVLDFWLGRMRDVNTTGFFPERPMLKGRDEEHRKKGDGDGNLGVRFGFAARLITASMYGNS